MRINEHVHILHHPFIVPVSKDIKLERFVYSFIILGKENVYLIDSGVKESFNTISEYMNRLGRGIDQISKLILTHAHPDHIGSAKQIKDATDCQVIAHSNAKRWIENINTQNAERPVPGFYDIVSESVQVDKTITDGQVIKLEENLSLKVIHTPGHSKDSISLLLENKGVLFTGDAILLPGHLPIYENIEETVSSVKKIGGIDNINTMLSSWDDPTFDEEIKEKIEKSLGYFKLLNQTIHSVENAKDLEPMELCKSVIEKLKMPPAVVNPLVAKSFQSHFRVRQELKF